MIASIEAKEEYYIMLTKFVAATIDEWKDKKYTGNMLINFTDGKVTNFKPSLVYGISCAPEMYMVFTDGTEN